jgi:hypothetical protein
MPRLPRQSKGGHIVTAKHSQGPWEADKHNGCKTIRDREGNDIADTCGMEEYIDLANANLMAAAPDILEALKRFLEYGDVFRYRTGERSPYEQAQEAIAKAEGRQATQ